ncbi:alpha/beta fold hydrolase [Alloacidobacterium dinghuense]|uniref:alpha/beta fold hydrolase n=1 Tax=Alloacidobacterium dinghuense TaxID=2763107 RepID=UPI002036E648|nr:alpha/beta fold hydrolase [Alloacidobacterium dinghuense]
MAVVFCVSGIFAFLATVRIAYAQDSSAWSAPQEGDYVAKDFHFKDGSALPELRLHYIILGKPHRDGSGHVDNAVLILHGTGGAGTQFLVPRFAGVLFVPGGLLDAQKYFIILPDDIGHGKSSKPSDGLHARFPKYDYDDMVLGEHLVVTQALGVDHLRLIMGTSMGCMHSWVWGETYPGFADALMPLACMPVPIAGRNRMTREMAMDAITSDPKWQGGEYKTEPEQGLKTAIDILLIMGSSPLQMQKLYPTRDAADEYLKKAYANYLSTLDANDFLYQFASSRNYDPSPNLEKISVPVMAINSADDFVNPPELDIMPKEIRRVPRGRFVLLPITDATRGHGTHTLPAIWGQYLAELLKESEPATAH